MSDFLVKSRAEHAWFAVLAVALSIFMVVTSEMLPVGVLSSIASSLDVSVGQAGLVISLPALLAAICAPLVVLIAGGIDRRHVLSVLLVLLIVVNALSAWTESFTVLLLARSLLGVCMGGIWAIAGGLAARLVPVSALALASSIIFGGVSVASVLGVPMGAALGEWLGWRWAFATMSGLSALVLVFHCCVVPSLPVRSSVSITLFWQQLGIPSLRLGLLLTLLLVAGHFMAFTFVRSLLLTVSGFDAEWIAALLLAYGVAAVAGNFIVGLCAAKYLKPTVISIAVGLSVTPLLFLFIGTQAWGGALVLLLWGLSYGGVSVGLMTWIINAAGQAVEPATAMYVAIFNVGIALGAWVGGYIVDGGGVRMLLYIAAVLASMALCLVLRSALKQFTHCLNTECGLPNSSLKVKMARNRE